MPTVTKEVLAVVMLILGSYFLYKYFLSFHWNDPKPLTSILHEGDDWASTANPACLPYGNSNTNDPSIPHTLCYDGSEIYVRGPSTRFQ